MQIDGIGASRRANGDANTEGTMMTRDPKVLWRGRSAVAGLCLLLALAGCGLNGVDIPGLNGPSTLGLSVVVTITPDVLVADAVSTASITATLRGPDGAPATGRNIFFAVTDENFNYVDLGTLKSTTRATPQGVPQIVEPTQANGVAQVIYRVPARESVTAIERIHITARLVSDDAQGQQTKYATLELRPAEVRRFPEVPGNTDPDCDFFIDPEIGPNPGGAYPTRFTIRFRSTASDPDLGGFIVRYFWDFGDGTQDDKPDVNKAYILPGVYTVQHVVTDNVGAQSLCFVDVVIAD